jgi:hypothetical protein
MIFTDITHFKGVFVRPDDGHRYSYDASFNAQVPVAWRADLSDGDGWSCRLAGAILDDNLSGPQLRAAVTVAIASDIRRRLHERDCDSPSTVTLPNGLLPAVE